MINEILIYECEGKAIEIRLDSAQETLRLTPRQLSELFERDVQTVSEHLKNIYTEQELTPDNTQESNVLCYTLISIK